MTLKYIFIFLGAFILGCKNPSKNQQLAASGSSIAETSSNNYLNKLKNLEHASAGKQFTDLGELINTIQFNVITENRKNYVNGIIPWASIENAKSELNQLVEGNKIVIKENKATIIIDYPLTNEYRFDLSSQDGFTRAELLKEISYNYYKLYEEEENSASIKTIPVDKRTTMYNRNQTNGKFGIWGHDIADLILTEILVYKTVGGQIILALNIES